MEYRHRLVQQKRDARRKRAEEEDPVVGTSRAPRPGSQARRLTRPARAPHTAHRPGTSTAAQRPDRDAHYAHLAERSVSPLVPSPSRQDMATAPDGSAARDRYALFRWAPSAAGPHPATGPSVARTSISAAPGAAGPQPASVWDAESRLLRAEVRRLKQEVDAEEGRLRRRVEEESDAVRGVCPLGVPAPSPSPPPLRTAHRRRRCSRGSGGGFGRPRSRSSSSGGGDRGPRYG